MSIAITPERLEQLKELSSLDWKELNAMRQIYLRYYGPWSAEAQLFNIEIRRRKALRVDYKLAVENIRRIISHYSKEVTRIDRLTFDTKHGLYDPITLEKFEPHSVYDPDDILTGKMAYRVAIERIKWLELEITQLQEHINIIQDGKRVTGITMDIIEAYNVDPHKYRKELNGRLGKLKQRVFPGTCRPLPAMFRHNIPVPNSELGLRPGDYLKIDINNKNVKPGLYKIIMGGVGLNRYYCRKLLERLEPEPGHRLFVANYSGGLGHYIITAPESCCHPKALNYAFTKDRNGIGYFAARRSPFSEEQP